MNRRPTTDEYAPFYSTYTERVPDENILDALGRQLGDVCGFLEGLPGDKRSYRYASGKWTVNQVVRHVVDVERIFSERTLWFARGNPGPLPGMDQEEFMAGVEAEQLDLTSLTAEFLHLRQANLALFWEFSPAVLDRRGVASDCEFTVRAKLHILFGHVDHHMNVIKERYL
jgi:hypothetical protein